MKVKDARIRALQEAAESMVQGSLSELTRQCGDPACACAHDPAQRHGPHLYFKFSSQGKTYSVYIPGQQSEALKGAQSAWRKFQQLGAEISADNRARFLQALEREKQRVRAQRLRPRGRRASD